MKSLESLAQRPDRWTPYPKELKCALAVQMTQQGYGYREIRDVLQVSLGFITQCNQRYQVAGVVGLKLNYWGTQGVSQCPTEAGVVRLAGAEGLLDD